MKHLFKMESNKLSFGNHIIIYQISEKKMKMFRYTRKNPKTHGKTQKPGFFPAKTQKPGWVFGFLGF